MKKILKKKNIKYYLIYYLIIEIVCRFNFIRGIIVYGYTFLSMACKAQNFESFIKAILILSVMFMIWILLIIFMTIPVTIALLAIKTADITHERQNKKYTSRENIIYYREKLKGISPTTISLMKNLNIEEEKDISATIMKLQLNKNIVIDENNIKVVSEDFEKLMPNEKELLYILKEGQINKKQIEVWKNVAIEEAKKAGYIKPKRSSTGLFIKKMILIIIMILFFYGFKYFGNSFPDKLDYLEQLGITEEMEFYEIAQNENFDIFINIAFEGLVAIICIVGMVAWPIFYIVFTVRYQNERNSLKRTIAGEKLTDVILGMKRFIHEFTLLSEADKESVILWDDFLVYAIVLEENKKIVEEIINIKNVKKIDSKVIIKE